MQFSKVFAFIFKENQLTFLGTLFLVVLGGFIIYLSLMYLPSGWMEYFGIGIGSLLVVFANIATRAKNIGLKPFTNDPLGWRAAKKTYVEDTKDKDKP